MQVRVKTNPYNNSSYCSHLVEHCVFSSYANIDNFFDIDIDANATSWLWYTKFYIPDYKKLQIFIDHITKPLDLSIVSKEKRIIKQEVCEEQNFTWNVLINKIGKILYGKGFAWYKSSEKLTYQQLQEYHNTYYHPENMWVLTDDFTVVSSPKLKTSTTHKKITQPQNHFEIKLEWKKFQVYIVPWDGIYQYAFCYFLDWLYTVMANYRYRYLWDEYDPPISHFFEFPDSLAFVRRTLFCLDLQEDFFEKSKRHFIQNEINIREIIAVHQIIKWEQSEYKDIKKYINNIRIQDIKKFL